MFIFAVFLTNKYKEYSNLNYVLFILENLQNKEHFKEHLLFIFTDIWKTGSVKVKSDTNCCFFCPSLFM